VLKRSLEASGATTTAPRRYDWGVGGLSTSYEERKRCLGSAGARSALLSGNARPSVPCRFPGAERLRASAQGQHAPPKLVYLGSCTGRTALSDGTTMRQGRAAG